MAAIGARIRAHLVDTTDDRIAMVEARIAVPAGVPPGAAARPDATDAGTPAWFDPFRTDDRP